MITCDTREKKWDHIRFFFDRMGIEYEVKKLDFADYSNPARPGIVVDRKQNLNEVATNLCSKDSSRFWREIRGAHKAGIKVVILVEHGPEIKAIRDVAAWKNQYGSMHGNRLMQEMFRTSMAYGVEWRFCSKAETAVRIMEILGLWNRDG